VLVKCISETKSKKEVKKGEEEDDLMKPEK
jgi:hypothetical protein